jgi:hypothetical protein
LGGQVERAPQERIVRALGFAGPQADRVAERGQHDDRQDLVRLHDFLPPDQVFSFLFLYFSTGERRPSQSQSEAGKE